MKKLFFFRSQSSNSGNNTQVSPPSTDKQVNWEKPIEGANNSRTSKHCPEDQIFGTTPSLRRSLSFSSGSLYDTGKGPKNYDDQNGSPCSTSYYSRKQSGLHTSRSRAPTPEKQTRTKCFDAVMVTNGRVVGKSDCIASRPHSDLSEISSHCSSNVSNKVLDRYIDGEQQLESSTSKSFSTRNHFENGNAVFDRPPRFQAAAPVSRDASKQKQRSTSFRETRAPELPFSSRDGAGIGACNESPRKIAKDVVERLSKSRLLPKTGSKEIEHDSPITIEDVYCRTLKRSSTVYSDEASPKQCTTDWHSETTNGSHQEDVREFLERESYSAVNDRIGKNFGAVTDTDFELLKKFNQAEDQAALLSEELQRENFLHFRGLSVPVLVERIKGLKAEKVNMALEFAAVLKDRIAERTLFREELKDARVELDAQTRRLEKEKNELQLALEKELDRRSTDWSFKLEKFQAEEHRLRERVRELAEQNVYLQREMSSLSEREMDAKTKYTSSKKQLEDLSVQVKEAKEESHCLHKYLSEMQFKCKASEEDCDCIRRNYEEKVNECKELHQAISRLQRSSSDQEKTIDGLRGLCEELGKQISKENFDSGLAKMQVEHMRLTGMEHALRKEVESCRVEIDSLRRENIDLLNRLKSNGKDVTCSTFKLDRELQSRIGCIQNQVFPLLMESSQLGRKLLEYVKNGSISGMGLDGQALIECEVKLQGLERAAENITHSIRTISSVLHEKSIMFQGKLFPTGMDLETPCSCDESNKQNIQKPEDIIRLEFKAETLLTNLLREKLYSKELDMEQLRAELASAVRGNDILKCELQSAIDNFSRVNHQMKDVELQMMKKDEIINQLQMDLQECRKEFAVIRGILPKVSEERDLMWEKVKKYSEKNMLLDAENDMLRKKIETLDEDILLKEGQITILKDSMSKPFDLLASPDSTHNFC